MNTRAPSRCCRAAECWLLSSYSSKVRATDNRIIVVTEHSTSAAEPSSRYYTDRGGL